MSRRPSYKKQVERLEFALQLANAKIEQLQAEVERLFEVAKTPSVTYETASAHGVPAGFSVLGPAMAAAGEPDREPQEPQPAPVEPEITWFPTSESEAA